MLYDFGGVAVTNSFKLSFIYIYAEVGSIWNTCILNTYLKYFLYLVFGIWNTANWALGMLVF